MYKVSYSFYISRVFDLTSSTDMEFKTESEAMACVKEAIKSGMAINITLTKDGETIYEWEEIEDLMAEIREMAELRAQYARVR